jgi:hypothetical protein
MDKLLEIGQASGTPIAYLVIILFAYKLFDIVATFIKTMSEIVVKFTEKHFTHIDNMEKRIQEISVTNSDNTKQFTQALNALNQIVTIQGQATSQNTQEVKPLVAAVNRVEQTIRHCEQMAAKRSDKE